MGRKHGERYNLNKKVELMPYYDVYKELLTSKQNYNLHLYCEEDLSLSEIAEICNVSRQAVWESISRGFEALEKFERVLGVVEKAEKLNKACDELLETVGSSDAYVKVNVKKIIDEQKKLLENWM